jgi:hypothetical protein
MNTDTSTVWRDARDAPLMGTMLQGSLIIPICLGAAIIDTQLKGAGMLRVLFWLGVMPLYVWFFNNNITDVFALLHQSSHRRLFKKPYLWITEYVGWFLVHFYGMQPGGFFVHHLGMHHAEENMPLDGSSTMRFQRDSFADFLRYVGRFYINGKAEMILYLWRKRRTKLIKRFFWAEVVQKGMWLLLALVSIPAAVLLGIVPYLALRWGLMMNNWGQHAFIDRRDPANPYAHSVTLIQAGKRCNRYGEGYHVAHHVKGNMPWFDMLTHLDRCPEGYIEHQSVIFSGLRGYPELWWLLMTRNHERLIDALALAGDVKLSREEARDFLLKRLEPIVLDGEAKPTAA